ncbi:MAG: hypothetical protein H6Q41_4101, partial [Deltaproteobacteria bacterium]|nr:hypothetical protein [Deltaproteobacteria bacterium]
MGLLICLGNKMAGDEVIFSFVEEQGFFRLAPFSGMGTSWLEQTSSIRRREAVVLFQESFLPFLVKIQFGDGLEQDLSVGVEGPLEKVLPVGDFHN